MRLCGTTGHTRRNPVAAMKKSYGCSEGTSQPLRWICPTLRSGSMLVNLPCLICMLGCCNAAISSYFLHAFVAYSGDDKASGEPIVWSGTISVCWMACSMSLPYSIHRVHQRCESRQERHFVLPQKEPCQVQDARLCLKTDRED